MKAREKLAFALAVDADPHGMQGELARASHRGLAVAAGLKRERLMRWARFYRLRGAERMVQSCVNEARIAAREERDARRKLLV